MAESREPVAPLTDSFGRVHSYLRISLTDRCNFRCVYCMPEEDVEWTPRSEILSFEEIERLASLFVRMGVNKIRLTGGEPTIRKGFLDLVERLSRLEGVDQLLLTTNGLLLKDLAKPMRSAGLTGINVSLDSLQRDRFEKITQREGLDAVLSGIHASIDAGLKTKVNVVVMPDLNDDEVCDFARLTRELPIQVRFIEFMPFLKNGWSSERVISSAELRSQLASEFNLVPIDGHPSDVAREFRVDGHAGTIGFVSSVTESFCGGCNRIRLTADGQFKVCLFVPPSADLKSLMREGRSDADIEEAIQTALAAKWAGHPPMRNWRQLDTLSMVQIGG